MYYVDIMLTFIKIKLKYGFGRIFKATKQYLPKHRLCLCICRALLYGFHADRFQIRYPNSITISSSVHACLLFVPSQLLYFATGQRITIHWEPIRYSPTYPVFRQMIKRLMFSTSYAVLTHYCVKYLPVSTVVSLSNVGPIFIFFIEAIYYRVFLWSLSAHLIKLAWHLLWSPLQECSW